MRDPLFFSGSAFVRAALRLLCADFLACLSFERKPLFAIYAASAPGGFFASSFCASLAT